MDVIGSMRRHPSQSKLDLPDDVEGIAEAGVEGIIWRHPSHSRLDVPDDVNGNNANDIVRKLDPPVGVEGQYVDCTTVLGDAHNADVQATSVVNITFCLERSETQLGEGIILTGSDLALGCWDPEHGVLLTTTPETYPRWTGTASLSMASSMPADGTVGAPRVSFIGAFDLEYKYVRDSRRIDGSFAWEQRPNRKITVPLSRNGDAWLLRDLGFGQPDVGVLQHRNNDGAAGVTFEKAYCIVGEQPLERGTFGAVWRCHALGGRDLPMLAAKRIDRSKLEDRDVRNLLGGSGREGEVLIHHQLQHTNIVQLFDFFEDRDVVSLIMELCHGGDLFSCIVTHRRCRGAGLREPVVARVVRHIFGALAFLHNRRIAHRDVKCENVLLDQECVDLEQITYKLCDFGFAARVPAEGVLHTVLGSAQTVAPEVLKKKPYSFPSDMWSAGVLVYIAIAGSEPFRAETLPLIVKKVVAASYSTSGGVWESASDAAKSFVGALMRVDPDARLSAHAALLCPLAGAVTPVVSDP
mmetsp:Transcript_81176/g.225935  ORF Transcript_81176/g.225935 Transcript_81176/m.225935 type:complete len:524 (+) Transcript_81176:71-1642(+)